jgi:hypothetical protein
MSDDWSFDDVDREVMQDPVARRAAEDNALRREERARLLAEIRCYSLQIPMGAVPGSVQPVGQWIAEHIEGEGGTG